MGEMTRRGFLGRTAATAGAVGGLASAAKGWMPSNLTAASRAAVFGANERIRFGVIGTGGQGQAVMRYFYAVKDANLACPVVCDVDDARIAQAVQTLAQLDQPKPDAEKDWRQVIDRDDLDFVLIATPDHWHALPTIAACQAGKDVYCEKPLANSIGESKRMLDAARKYERIVQMGTQWKTAKTFEDAIAYVHSGKLGKIKLVRCYTCLDWFTPLTPSADGPVPPGVDYDMWLGPAPKRPFNPARFHFTFRWFWDYAGGLMTDWGVHLLNIALWGMKAGSPKRVSASGGKYVSDDMAETPDTMAALFDYGDFTLIWEHQAGTGHGPEGRPHGVVFYGTDGTLIVNQSGWQVWPEKGKEDRNPAVKHDTTEHRVVCRTRLAGDFLESMQTRKPPAMDIGIGFHVTSVAHLGNLALRTGSSVEYDAANLKVIGNDPANDLITPTYRAPWKLPEIG